MVHVLSALSSLALVAGALGIVAAAPAPQPKYWFAFGDSYTATSFNVTTGPLPNLENPFGNPIYPGYTACGLFTNYIDDLTAVYNKSLIFTYNFAYGGATIDANLVTPYLPTVLSLIDQVNEYLDSVASRPASTPWTPENSIFSFFIGINDIGNSWSDPGSRTAFDEVLLDTYFELVEKVYNTGARNFLFINVPPVNRSPLMLAETAADQAGEKTVIDGFNARLAARVAEFDLSGQGVKALFYDSSARVNQILDNPQKYGFVDSTTFGTNATDYCWCNNYHISPGVHSYLAKDISALFELTLTPF
ncbi:hypothetical protein FRB96_008080 [Tulasnella sp. 330]|nr:hypothetical protein FRB96_008080 [Tulasnella sp. 330]KAG8876623.1 hypothetical protein FRB97_004065 [Tulasnella sp. 331]KAG8878495.1 hypothetical protein FRB98_006104 [Tulasnella sp. 332]